MKNTHVSSDIVMFLQMFDFLPYFQHFWDRPFWISPKLHFDMFLTFFEGSEIDVPGTPFNMCFRLCWIFFPAILQNLHFDIFLHFPGYPENLMLHWGRPMTALSPWWGGLRPLPQPREFWKASPSQFQAPLPEVHEWLRPSNSPWMISKLWHVGRFCNG